MNKNDWIAHRLYSESNRKFLDNFDMYEMPEILDYLPVSKGIAILDIGCGCGLLLGYLQRLGYINLIGIDIVPEMADDARYRFNNSIQIICDDFFDFDFGNNKYDCIFAIDVLEHIKPEQSSAFLKKIYGSLNKNGQVFIRVPNAASVLAAYMRYMGPDHKTIFTNDGLDFLMLPIGFERGHIINCNQYKPFWVRFVIRLRHWIYDLLYKFNELPQQKLYDPLLLMVYRKADKKAPG